MSKTRKTKNGVRYVEHREAMAEWRKDPEFRYHYEQRKLSHELALAVRGMRKNAGLTQAQLAKKIGVQQPMIARIEKGIGQSTPRWGTLHRIIIALGGQLKLSFMSHMPEEPEALVELDGKPAGTWSAMEEQTEPS